MTFWIVFIIGIIATIISTYVSQRNEGGSTKNKVILLSCSGIIATLALAIVANWLYDNMASSPPNEIGNGNYDNNSNTSASNNIEDTGTGSFNDSYTTTTFDNVGAIKDSNIETNDVTTSSIETTENSSPNYSTDTEIESTTDANVDVSDSSYETFLYVDVQNGKWGYVDQFRKERIQHIYDWADEFFDGYAAVCKGHTYGFIDSNGTEVIPFVYDGTLSFIDGLAPVFNGEKWGFIDENGTMKIPFKFITLSRAYDNDKEVYFDENFNMIDYNAEINNKQNDKYDTSENTQDMESISNNEIESSQNNQGILIRASLRPYVSATLEDSKLNISIHKSHIKDLYSDASYPLKWGIYLTNGLKEDEVNDYKIALEFCVESDYTIIATNACVYFMKSLDNMTIADENITTLDTYFDGEYYIVSCDINNDYIDVDNICVNNFYYYEPF